MRFGVCVVTTPAIKRPLLVGLLVGGIACGWHLNLCLLGRQVKVVKLELTCSITTVIITFSVEHLGLLTAVDLHSAPPPSPDAASVQAGAREGTAVRPPHRPQAEMDQVHG